MLRVFSIAFLAVLFVPLIILHSIYGLGYISRVYLYQESDTGDINWKPQIKLRRAAAPSELPLQTESNRVTAAFLLPSSAKELDAFFEENNSTSLLIAQNGQLIYETYFNDQKADQPVATFSVSKSVFSMLLGRILGEDTHDFMQKPITRYLPELEEKDSRFSLITPTHLLNMRSGIAFNSDVSFPFFNEDKPLVYYADDLVDTLFKHVEIESDPGSFRYNDYNPNLLALALERATGQSFIKLLESELWTPIGAKFDAVWMSDYQGFPLIESGLGAAPADLVRIGQLMLDVGRSTSDYMPKMWHSLSTQTNQRKPVYTFGDLAWHYQYGWWITPHSDGSADYAAMGHLGQYIYISPKNNIVIVRTGTSQGNLDDAEFLQLFYDAAQALGKD